jgi:hypothetical protein
MAWTPNSKEIESVLQLADADRYNYLIKRIADQEELWSLWEAGGWALTSDDEGHELGPKWPHPKYAELCAKGPWLSSKPKSISLDAWLARWTAGIKRDRRLIAAFPSLSDKAAVVDADRFAADIQQELAKYEL